jgi:hypothetical protein
VARRLCLQSSSLQIRGYLPSTNQIALRGRGICQAYSSGTLNVSPNYATLSHSWGKSKFLTLISGNMHEFENRVPLEALTKTFQDAIFITRQLNLDYIWIDSLCIIQDSVEDWATESALMSSVYGGSHINIAASASKSGSEGCHLKPPNFVGAVRIRDSSNQRYDITPSSLCRQSVTFAHLATRAWVVQERLLASRALYFGKTDLFWECKTKAACESFPIGLPANFATRGKWKSSLREAWHSVVSEYSRSNLTYGSDKLIALSSIAHKAQIQSGDVYLARIWRKDLELQLCCERMDGDGRSPLAARPMYRAPSWSWASIDGVIFYHHNSYLVSSSSDFRRFVDVLDCTVIPAGKDPLGALIGAELILRYRHLFSGKLKLEGSPQSCFEANGLLMKIGISLDTSDCSDGDTISVLPVYQTSHECMISGDDGFEAVLALRIYGLTNTSLKTHISKSQEMTKISWLSQQIYQ